MSPFLVTLERQSFKQELLGIKNDHSSPHFALFQPKSEHFQDIGIIIAHALVDISDGVFPVRLL